MPSFTLNFKSLQYMREGLSNMKKKLYSRLAGVLALMLMLTMMPVYSFGATATLKDDIYNDFHLGKNYNVTFKVGKKPMYSCVECDYGEDYESDDYPYITSVKCSDSTIAKVYGLDGDGTDFYFELKGLKAGTATVTAKFSNGKKSVFYVTVGNAKSKNVNKNVKSKIEAYNWIYKHTTKVFVDVKNPVKGDRIKLKIGNKTYTRKVTKTAKKLRVKIRISKPGFYGKKYNLALVRKGKTVAREVQYVFLSNYVHVGDTKSKVRWITYWNDPDKKNQYASGEQWCYDWGDVRAYLYFNNRGVVTNWQKFEY